MKKNHLVVVPLMLCCNLSFGQIASSVLFSPFSPPDLVKKEVLHSLSPLTQSTLMNTEIISDSSFEKGVLDARIFYSKHSKPAGATLATSILTGPLGLIPALACSATPPKTHNLGFPEVTLIRNTNYYAGYTQTAFGIKKKKVWKNFTIGVFVFAIPAFFVINKITNND